MFEKPYKAKLHTFVTLLCIGAFALPSFAQPVKSYHNMDLFELKQRVNQGDILAKYWVAKKSDIFADKVTWYQRYAEAYKNSRSTSYISDLYDGEEFEDKQDPERAYYWYYATDMLCKREEYKEEWCAKAAERLPALKENLPKQRVAALEKQARSWVRNK